MGCNCKTQKKLRKKIDAQNGVTEKKGVLFYIKEALNEVILRRVLPAIIIFAICIVLFPFVLIVLVGTQLIMGSAKMIGPTKLLKRLKEDNENGRE